MLFCGDAAIRAAGSQVRNAFCDGWSTSEPWALKQQHAARAGARRNGPAVRTSAISAPLRIHILWSGVQENPPECLNAGTLRLYREHFRRVGREPPRILSRVIQS